MLESTVTNARSLGVPVDWMELRSPRGFGAPAAALARGGAGLGLATASLCLVGAGVWTLGGVNLSLALLLGVAFATNPIAAERMLRGGTSAALLVFTLAMLLAWGSKLISLSRVGQTWLIVITVATLISRTAFLHPQAFYPDYRVQALVQQAFNGQKLPVFLDRPFELQFARSLGLQQIGAEWYPFPYPPGSYAVADIIGSARDLDALDALTVASIAAAALISFLPAGLGPVSRMG